MLEILKPDILRRLTKRLGIKPPPGGPIGWLSNIVLQVTSVDDLLKDIKLVKKLQTITATGRLTFFTVPAGKRWRLKNISGENISGSSVTDNISICDGPVRIRLAASLGSTFQVNLDQTLKELWDIEAYHTMTTTGNYQMGILVEEEDAY